MNKIVYCHISRPFTKNLFQSKYKQWTDANS